MTKHQALALEKEQNRLQGIGQPPRLPPAKILVTGVGIPEKIEALTIRLALALADRGLKVLCCHRYEDPRFSRRDNFFTVSDASPFAGNGSGLALTQAAGLDQSAFAQVSAIQLSNHGDNGRATPVARPERLWASTIVPRLVQAVYPSHLQSIERAWPAWREFDCVLAAGHPHLRPWTIGWWKRADFVVLVSGIARSDLIDCYLQVKRLREYPPQIVVVIESACPREAGRAFARLAGATGQFLGIKATYLGALPPFNCGGGRSGELALSPADNPQEFDKHVAALAERLILVALRRGHLSLRSSPANGFSTGR